MTRDELVRMERCHIRAWPAFGTRDVQGWHWRFSGGGSQRANSVSTIDFNGDDPTAALAEAESLYQAKGVSARVQTFDFTEPAGLDGVLRTRGYRATEGTLTMVKHIEPQTAPADTERYGRAESQWQEVYLGAITENRRSINTLVLDTIPEPRAFFACRRAGKVISTALSVIGFGCAVVECVATREDARRQGGAEATLRALEAWAVTQEAALLGLQVVATNTPAVALYERLGFVTYARNRFWVRP